MYAFLILLSLLSISGDIHPNPGPEQNVKVCHINARSILTVNRLDLIKHFLSIQGNADILCVSETHLDANISDRTIEISGYTLYRNDRSRKGGGVAIYVTDMLPSIRKINLETDIEMLLVEVEFRHRHILIGVYYRPPGMSLIEVESFLTLFESSLFNILNKYKTVLLTGYFNDRCQSWNGSHLNSELDYKLVDLLNRHNISQIISQPTRKENLLDLIITGSLDCILDSGVDIAPDPNLDHCMVWTSLTYTYPHNSVVERQVWY